VPIGHFGDDRHGSVTGGAADEQAEIVLSSGKPVSGFVRIIARNPSRPHGYLPAVCQFTRNTPIMQNTMPISAPTANRSLKSAHAIRAVTGGVR
jgi:hypothetical protein